MSALSDKVADEALSLPVELRLELVDALLRSLNMPTRAEVDAAWAREAERRVEQVDRGEAGTADAGEVFGRARDRLQR